MTSDRTPQLAMHNWKTQWEQALGVAQQKGCPVLLVVAAPWCAFSRNLLERILVAPAVRELLEGFVLVRLGPDSDPEAAALWRRVVIHLTHDQGPPLVLFLSPEGFPFLAGGYFSDQPSEGKPTLAALLQGVKETWAERPEEVKQEARELWQTITASAESSENPLNQRVQQAYTNLQQSFDAENAGFEPAPKLLRPGLLRFLAAYHRASGEPNLLQMLSKTLQQQLRGGIWDQLGGGFHRASRDERWIVPYFEKLLPINAQMMLAHAEAGAANTEVIRKIADFLCTHLLNPEGLFWAGLAADKDYYGWTSEELIECVPREHVQAIALRYHLTPHHSKHVLYAALEPSAMYPYTYENEEVLKERIAIATEHMLQARQRRLPPRPMRQVFSSWNALVVEGLLEASRTTGEVSYRDTALRTLEVLESRTKNGVMHDLTSGTAQPLLLEDFAAMGLAHLAAHRVAQHSGSLNRAQEIAAELLKTFFDSSTQQLYSSTAHPQLAQLGLSRWEHLEDTDLMPSPTGLALLFLIELSRQTQESHWADTAAIILQHTLPANPGIDHGALLLAAQLLDHPR